MPLNPSIKKVVPPTPPSALASYDYYDIADGTGIKNFYAGCSIMSGANFHWLTTDTSLYSGKTGERRWSYQSTTVPASDLNYDVTFNKSKVIKGTIRVSLSMGLAGDADSRNVRLVLNLYKVSDGVQTQIGSQMETLSYTKSDSGTQGYTENLSTTQDTKVFFKEGDILRLNVKLWGYANDASVGFGYGCDPADRDDTTDLSGVTVIPAANTTQLKVGIPFLLQINN